MSRNAGSDVKAAYLFIAPAVIGFLVFVGYPLIRSFYLALTKYNGLTDPVFVGLGNFRRLFTTDPAFWPSLRATGYLVLLYVPLSLVLGLALAMFCNQRFAGVRIVRTLAYLPVVLPAVATITLWKFILDPQVGLLNTILDRLAPADEPVVAGPGYVDAVHRDRDAVGRRRDDDHLPRRAAVRADRTVRGRPRRRRRPVRRCSSGSRCR